MGLAGPCVDKPRVAEWRGVEEGDGLAGGRPIGPLTGFIVIVLPGGNAKTTMLSAPSESA